MNFNFTPEQKQKITQIVIQGVMTMLIAILAVLGYNIIVVQPQLAAQQARMEQLRNELGMEVQAPTASNSAPTYSYNPAPMATSAPAAILESPLRCKASGVACVVIWNGSDLIAYSDGGITTKFSVDGATGNTYLAGILQKGAGATVAVTLNARIVPVASIQPITSTAVITASTLITTNVPANATVTLINKNASNAITLTNSSTLILPSASDLALGANDTVTLWWDGSRWICIAATNN